MHLMRYTNPMTRSKRPFLLSLNEQYFKLPHALATSPTLHMSSPWSTWPLFSPHKTSGHGCSRLVNPEEVWGFGAIRIGHAPFPGRATTDITYPTRSTCLFCMIRILWATLTLGTSSTLGGTALHTLEVWSDAVPVVQTWVWDQLESFIYFLTERQL